jgi:hypothetical protein
MEITGKIIVALEPRSGVSNNTGNPWKMQSFVLETTTEQYPRRCVFDVFGEDRLNQFNIQVGQEYTVSFDIDAREYQGRWFNSIRAWRVAAPQAMGDSPFFSSAPGYGAPAPAPQGGFTQPAAGAGNYGQAPTAPAAPSAPAAPTGPEVQSNPGDDLPF